jgi:hypothetical protein
MRCTGRRGKSDQPASFAAILACASASAVTKRALPLVERAAMAEPANSEINDHLGDIYWALGRSHTPPHAVHGTARQERSACQLRRDFGLRIRLRGNLALHVRRRRADGYHELETLFAFCRDGDVVTVDPPPRTAPGTPAPPA